MKRSLNLDLERRNRVNCVISLSLETCVPTHNLADLWRNLCNSLLYFVVRVRCRRKESSRSLSHLLLSFFVSETVTLKRQLLTSCNTSTSFLLYSAANWHFITQETAAD